MGRILRNLEEIKKLQPKFQSKSPNPSSPKIDFSGEAAADFRKVMGMENPKKGNYTPSTPAPTESNYTAIKNYFDDALDDRKLMKEAERVFQETDYIDKNEAYQLNRVMASIGTNPNSVKLTAGKLYNETRKKQRSNYT